MFYGVFFGKYLVSYKIAKYPDRSYEFESNLTWLMVMGSSWSCFVLWVFTAVFTSSWVQVKLYWISRKLLVPYILFIFKIHLGLVAGCAQ